MAVVDKPTRPLLAERLRTPSSPKTPLANRSISATFGSPGSYAREQDDTVIYELNPRTISVGFAGEARPRCIWRFGHSQSEYARVGDFSYTQKKRAPPIEECELYRADLRHLNLSLMEAKLERVVRNIHQKYLQLDARPRRAALVVSALTPSRVLEIVLSVLFNHYTQPPSITILTSPIMSCVSAGVRDALVVEIGWEETIVSAISEYKTIAERRSIRGGKMLVDAFAQLLQQHSSDVIDFSTVEEVKTRMAWCKSKQPTKEYSESVSLPIYDDKIEVSFESLSKPADTTFFDQTISTRPDDNEHTLPRVIHEVLRSLPQDLRAICAQRIIIDGLQSQIPGLKRRILQETQSLIDTNGWNAIEYRNMTRSLPLQERPVNLDTSSSPENNKKLPAHLRALDDVNDRVTNKAERELLKRRVQPFTGKIRGVDSLGAWAGASIVSGLKVKGICEVEREDFLKHGLKDAISLLI